MTVMSWGEQFRIGVESMDAQHQRLIEIMNRLHDLYEADASRDEQSKVLGELAEFTVKHFQDEEAHMEAIGYDRLDSHQTIHKQLLSEFASHQQAFEKTGELTPRFFNFLKLWLTAHIQGIDSKYADASR